MGARAFLLVPLALLALGGTASAADTDGDGVVDEADDCPAVANADQADADSDGVGNLCDDCPTTANPDQIDSDGDHVGNACDVCPRVVDADQEDDDEDGVGDACDRCADSEPDVARADLSLRLVVDPTGCSVSQSCPCDGPLGHTWTWGTPRRYRGCVRRHAWRLARLGRLDFTERVALTNVAVESECGTERGLPGDRDGDGILDDGDESHIVGDARCTGGAVAGCDDNCPGARNPRQLDRDGDGTGDACDPDMDGDGFANDRDSCPRHPDPTRADTDDDGVGNACDRCPGTPEAEDVDRKGCAEGETPQDAGTS